MAVPKKRNQNQNGICGDPTIISPCLMYLLVPNAMNRYYLIRYAKIVAPTGERQ
jgi:hypothetical protein